MNSIRSVAGIIFLTLVWGLLSSAQDKKAVNPVATPPNLLLLVHQEFQLGRGGARQKLEMNMARACDRLDVPNSWIALQSLTGSREVLSFDPFDSFEQLEQAAAGWAEIYASHSDLAQMQQEIDSLLASERTIVAVRRDDLSYHADTIDLSGMRFMRVLEVRLFPGHESDFAESVRTLGEAHEKIRADVPWVAYQVNVGMPAPTFYIFFPMAALKQNDEMLAWKESLLEAEGGDGAQRLEQILREAYAGAESNLYAVSPETSHVTKEFAAGDPDFWHPRMATEVKPEMKPGPKPTKKELLAKPQAQ